MLLVFSIESKSISDLKMGLSGLAKSHFFNNCNFCFIGTSDPLRLVLVIRNAMRCTNVIEECPPLFVLKAIESISSSLLFLTAKNIATF